MVSIVVGGHYGDEGKGKIIGYLATADNPPLIVRAGVGPNAGHTIYKEGKKYGLRMIPCGFVNEKSRLAIGAGVLVDPARFLDEVTMTDTSGRIFVDSRCAVITDEHKKTDKAKGKKIGTTGSGCGPANAARANRVAKQVKDVAELSDYLIDVPSEVNKSINRGEEVLIEASQGFGLSLYYGNYPYVTSKDTSASTAAADAGVGPTKVDDVIVVYKAYMSRVGEDPHIKYLSNEEIESDPVWKEVLKRAQESNAPGENDSERIAHYLGEKGTVTGRPRKIGSFDYQLAKYSAMVNGATQIAVTCLDKLFPECAGAKKLDGIGSEAKDHVKKIEEEIGVRATLLSTGPNPEDVVDLR